MTTFSLVHHSLRSRAIKSIAKKKIKKKRKISKHWQRVLVMEDSTKRERNGNQAPRKGQRSNLSYKER